MEKRSINKFYKYNQYSITKKVGIPRKFVIEYWLYKSEKNNEEKEKQEKQSLMSIDDSFKKIIVVKDNIMPRRDDYGITTIGIYNFLLDKNSLEL